MKANKDKITWGLLVLILVLSVYQTVQISKIASTPTGLVTGGTTTESSAGTGVTAQQILKEITPTGTPDYGAKAGVSFDKVEQGLQVLSGYDRSIVLDDLTESEKQRYIKIATTPGTACEYCCGIGGAGFGRSDGSVACGCSHNVAFSGLTKWLIKNTGYTDDQIVQEIQKWKILFFPEGSVRKELEKRNIAPEDVGLPAMRGGC